MQTGEGRVAPSPPLLGALEGRRSMQKILVQNGKRRDRRWHPRQQFVTVELLNGLQTLLARNFAEALRFTESLVEHFMHESRQWPQQETGPRHIDKPMEKRLRILKLQGCRHCSHSDISTVDIITAREPYLLQHFDRLQ